MYRKGSEYHGSDSRLVSLRHEKLADSATEYGAANTTARIHVWSHFATKIGLIQLLLIRELVSFERNSHFQRDKNHECFAEFYPLYIRNIFLTYCVVLLEKSHSQGIYYLCNEVDILRCTFLSP